MQIIKNLGYKLLWYKNTAARLFKHSFLAYPIVLCGDVITVTWCIQTEERYQRWMVADVLQLQQAAKKHLETRKTSSKKAGLQVGSNPTFWRKCNRGHLWWKLLIKINWGCSKTRINHYSYTFTRDFLRAKKSEYLLWMYQTPRIDEGQLTRIL